MGKRVARQVLRAAGQYPDVVLYTYAAERSQPIDTGPVDVMLGRRTAEILEQHVDDVQTGLDRQHHILLKYPR